MAIFKNQTADEQVSEDVRHDNGMGFRAVDAKILASFMNQLQARGTLSPKQNALLMKKMPRYARQLIKFYGAEKIAKAL